MQTLAASLPGIAAARPETGADRKIKALDRAAQWRRDLLQRVSAMLATASPAKAQIIEAEYQRELERGPGWSRCRRDARFMELPTTTARLDRNQAVRMLMYVEALARRLWAADVKAARASGQRMRRTIPVSAVAVYKALLGLAQRHGHVFPSYHELARQACVSRDTAIQAVKLLAAWGLVSITRRAKLVETWCGKRMVQDSNLYAVAVAPTGLAALAGRALGVELPGRGSESDSHPARATPTLKTAASHASQADLAGSEARPRSSGITWLPPCSPGRRRIPWWAMIRR